MSGRLPGLDASHGIFGTTRTILYHAHGFTPTFGSKLTEPRLLLEEPCPGESTQSTHHTHLDEKMLKQPDVNVTLLLIKRKFRSETFEFSGTWSHPNPQESRKPPLTESVEMSRQTSHETRAFQQQHISPHSTFPNSSTMTHHTTPLLLQLLSFWNFCSSTVPQIAGTLRLCQTWRGSRRDRCGIHTPTLLPLFQPFNPAATSAPTTTITTTGQATTTFLLVRLHTGLRWKLEYISYIFAAVLVINKKVKNTK